MISKGKVCLRNSAPDPELTARMIETFFGVNGHLRCISCSSGTIRSCEKSKQEISDVQENYFSRSIRIIYRNVYVRIADVLY